VCDINHTPIYVQARIIALPDDGVTAPKHVGAVLMQILILFLRHLTIASVGE
jgi:hypothetical protein